MNTISDALAYYYREPWKLRQSVLCGGMAVLNFSPYRGEERNFGFVVNLMSQGVTLLRCHQGTDQIGQTEYQPVSQLGRFCNQREALDWINENYGHQPSVPGWDEQTCFSEGRA